MMLKIEKSRDINYPVQIYIVEGRITRDCGLFSIKDCWEIITNLQETIKALEKRIGEQNGR